MNTIKSNKNFGASYNSSSGFAENDTNYITQKNFYPNKISLEQSPNFESNEFNTFKKSNTFNNSNNITATFYKKSKNMDEEMKGEDFYINERRKKKVLNMIKNAHIEKLKNFIYLKEINFAYDEMQRYMNEGDFASSKEMERYLNSLQTDVIQHNIDSFSKTKLARSHATFGQTYKTNFSSGRKNLENRYQKVISRGYENEEEENKYEEEKRVVNNKTKKKNKNKKTDKQNNINQINSERNYKTYEYESNNNMLPNANMNNNNIIYNNIPNNINSAPPNSEALNNNYQSYINNNIKNNEMNDNFNNNIINASNKINNKNINKENPKNQELNPQLSENQEINNINNINNINQNGENENMRNNSNIPENLPNNQYEEENKIPNINQNMENDQINNNLNINPNQEQNPTYQNPVNPIEQEQINKIPKDNKEYPKKGYNISNQNNQILMISNSQLSIPQSKSQNNIPENNYQNIPNENNYNIYPENNNLYPPNDKMINNNIPFNPDNTIPNNKYPNYNDLNNPNQNNLINPNNYLQNKEKSNVPQNNIKKEKRINPKQVLRNPRPNNNKIKRPKSSKGPLINKNNNYYIPNYEYPRKYYENSKSKKKSRSKSSSRNRSNTPKILFAEQSKGKCFACDINCSISRSGNSPNKYVPYYGPLKKERKHITEYDGEKYGYYEYKSRIPESD